MRSEGAEYLIPYLSEDPEDPNPVTISAPVVENWDDHISIGDFAVMKMSYYKDKLDNLKGFDGFVGRWYIPAESLTFSKTETTAIITVIVMDTAHEI